MVRIRPPPPFFYVRMGYSQAVRQQTLTLSFPWFESRYPSQEDPLAQPVEHLTLIKGSGVRIACGSPFISPGGEIGRRTGLKNPADIKIRAGSTPALGTIHMRV